MPKKSAARQNFVQFQTLKKIPKRFLRNKRVLVRVDFNVPLDKNTNAIMSDERIRAAIPTISFLVKHNAKVILMSHLGRPDGKKDGKKDAKFSLSSVAERLSQLLKKGGVTKDKVKFINDCIGDKVRKSVGFLKPGDICLLENLRFYKEEEANDQAFAKQLSQLGTLYINDAFGTSHRAHASTYGIAKHIPAAAGFLLEKEIAELNKAMLAPKRPFVAVLGGAKVSDKIGMIQNLSKRADAILIGGAMMFTFLKAMGTATGKSLVEDEKLELARSLLKESKNRILLPTDVVIVEGIDEIKEVKQKIVKSVVSVNNIPNTATGLDIGPETSAIYRGILEKAKTIVWNGPLGYFEVEDFKAASKEVAEEIVLATEKGAVSIAGGGETTALLAELGLAEKFTHISTGGGASLEFLEGKELSGIRVLKENYGKFWPK